MERLWAPWRMEYIKGPRERTCIFCSKPRMKNDRKNLILIRGDHSFVILNAYPYNSGHLMVAPYRHVGDMRALRDNELLETMKLTRTCIDVLVKAMAPHGFNIGINQGKVAGAGIKDHIHLHVIPRWGGDTNFMPIIAETKVLPQHLLTTYENLLSALPQHLRARLMLDERE